MKRILVEPLSDRTALLDDEGFLFNLIFMKYILDCVNERGLDLEINVDYKFVCITIRDDEESKSIFLDEDSVYELIGALHHIQKQLKAKSNG